MNEFLLKGAIEPLPMGVGVSSLGSDHATPLDGGFMLYEPDGKIIPKGDLQLRP